MCTGFTDLNKVCPKDFYPLPSIDALVNRTLGHQVLCFMDTDSIYNHIKMNHLDASKIAYKTDTAKYYNVAIRFERCEKLLMS